MQDKLEQRLKELRAEFESGRSLLADLNQRKATLEETLLRISGAIQVLEELLAADQPASNGVPPSQAEGAFPGVP